MVVLYSSIDNYIDSIASITAYPYLEQLFMKLYIFVCLTPFSFCDAYENFLSYDIKLLYVKIYNFV